MDKSGSASKNEKEHTEKLDTKKRYLPLGISDDKKMAGQEPKDMIIKTNKSAHDEQKMFKYVCITRLRPYSEEK